MSCWLTFGGQSAWLALIYAVFLAGLITATFIDFEHFIIPDEITVGGMVVGFVCSFLLPSLHGQTSLSGALQQSLLGVGAGAGIIYFILRMGKLLFGRQKVTLPADTKIIFSETAVHLPGQEIPYEDLFYRKSDVITLNARTLELVDRCYRDVQVRLTPTTLRIGEEELSTEDVPHLEAECSEIVFPREAMGLGDVKFMAAIGAFLGWQAVVFSLMLSSMIGSVIGVTLILLRKREWSSRLPYGPYIALAAAIWVFGGKRLVQWWFGI
jgi:leader peptidase (prepilin peptidase)/N-methyltransferase